MAAWSHRPNFAKLRQKADPFFNPGGSESSTWHLQSLHLCRWPQLCTGRMSPGKSPEVHRGAMSQLFVKIRTLTTGTFVNLRNEACKLKMPKPTQAKPTKPLWPLWALVPNTSNPNPCYFIERPNAPSRCSLSGNPRPPREIARWDDPARPKMVERQPIGKSIKIHKNPSIHGWFSVRIYSHILYSHLIIFNLQNDCKSTNTWESTTPKLGFNMF